ncbi:MAG: dihydroorotase, partial [Anaplasmataceae bacterium]|nr:dihydroorotase [Anaplasmataceae bacterium]
MEKWHQRKQHNEVILFKNARIIDPLTRMDALGSLKVQNGKIVKIYSDYDVDESDVNKIIDCKKNILMPGIIDLQCHLREPGQTHKEDIKSGSKSAARGGITTGVCQPNTKPLIADIITFQWLQNIIKEKSYINIEIYPQVSIDNALTPLEQFAELGAVGFTNDGAPVDDPLIMKYALMQSKTLNLPIAQHAEDISLTNGGCIADGYVSEKLGVAGISNSSESTIVARDILLTEETGGVYHLLHASTKQSVEMIKIAKDKGLNVTCEAAPHHFILNESAVLEHGTLAKMNPPLRSEEDRQAIEDGLKSGVIDCIATDHAPHEVESKNLPLEKAAFGIVGFETLLPLSLRLYHEKGMELIDVLQKLTCNPAKVIRKSYGVLTEGAPADIVLFSL